MSSPEQLSFYLLHGNLVCGAPTVCQCAPDPCLTWFALMWSSHACQVTDRVLTVLTILAVLAVLTSQSPDRVLAVSWRCPGGVLAESWRCPGGVLTESALQLTPGGPPTSTSHDPALLFSPLDAAPQVRVLLELEMKDDSDFGTAFSAVLTIMSDITKPKVAWDFNIATFWAGAQVPDWVQKNAGIPHILSELLASSVNGFRIIDGKFTFDKGKPKLPGNLLEAASRAAAAPGAPTTAGRPALSSRGSAAASAAPTWRGRGTTERGCAQPALGTPAEVVAWGPPVWSRRGHRFQGGGRASAHTTC
eukprot:CAMPEP_0202802332 /NCGR_PEP_ID=MMETSP1388-20130828/102587_1 /ASSEMBLY_ACC=CAM_ASM_000864 /TAXON_ID=37098 /ORGANISM="Isochrysis sp, Strain CCMP1244" /LENGTH=304 /DNA_ID=CAMNT_0049472323 /DNA_START=96 /DNA_END=1014 /DNA_ORIENTATION=-